MALAQRGWRHGKFEAISDRLERNSIPEPNSGCTLWLGALSANGHGRMKIRGRWESPHRVSYEEARGPIPTGLFVCHRCDVRSCINPDHLFLGTHAANMADMKAKGRAAKPLGAAKLTRAQVETIRADVRPFPAVARDHGIDRRTVGDIKRGRTWRA